MSISSTDFEGTGRGCPSGLEPATDDPDGGAAPLSIADPAPFVRTKGGRSYLELAVFGARCAGCISKIEGAMRSFPGMETARLSLSTGRLTLGWSGSAIAPADVVERLQSLGYRTKPYDSKSDIDDADAYGRQLLLCLAVAGFATANIMLLSIAVWAGSDGEMGPGTRGFMHLVSAMIAIPAVAFAGRPFFASAFDALKVRHVNMDVPISLAVILATGLSLYEAARGGHEAYFDAAVMLLFFLLIGRYLDHRLRARARSAARDLIALQATTAHRLLADGTLEVVSARDLVPGDRVLLSPGDRAPVDGKIMEGRSSVDMSLVTGESEPVTLDAGAGVQAGVLNLSAQIVMEAEKSADDSLIAELSRLIEAGEQGKGKYVRLADKAASIYVPVVHTLALGTFVIWYFFLNAGFNVALLNAVALLIITCPCALGLATPAVQIVATGRLFRSGILVKSGDALERLAEVDQFVFDKTGTLTHGDMRVLNGDQIDKDVLQDAASLARISRHPLSRAIVAVAGSGKAAPNAIEQDGFGIEGQVRGETARLGKAEWVGAQDHEGWRGGPVTWYRRGIEKPICFRFHDQLREDAQHVVKDFVAAGKGVSVLSGDRKETVGHVASQLGVAHWFAETVPQEKVNILNKLKDEGSLVAMVGDGLNDGPSLAAAHVSLSPGTAADASQAAADFVYQGSSLGPVKLAYDVARLAKRRVLENFGFAACYNAVAVPLAALGFVTPLIAALAMSGSSLVVTLNALRLSTSRRGEAQP